MFVRFFFHLRRRGLHVSLGEWMDLMRALSLGLAGEALPGFYHLTRLLVVKHEGQLDLFDQCFAEYFEGVEAPASLTGEVLDWLKDPKLPRALSDEERAMLKALDLEELRRQFEERLKEQKERHDGGSKWVGTGGTSPFGHGGFNPAGVRVGGEGGMRSAMQIATQRRFRNLRGDVTLDTRQISLALKKLRRLSREGAQEELDIDESIAQTAKNAGEIELVFRAPRKNHVKLLLLMDVGGSMTAHTRVSEQLFSAANAVNHFKEFRSYYFHNCVYDVLFKDMQRLDTVSTLDVLRDVDETWHLMLVGDAAMSPYELIAPHGCIDYWVQNEEPGVVWLQRLRDRMPRSVWLNPEREAVWEITSTRLVRKVFPDMFPLTLDGLDDAIERLRKPQGTKPSSGAKPSGPSVV